MPVKVFGKELFKKRKELELYDFAQHGLIRGDPFISINDLVMAVDETPEETARKKKEKAKKAEKPEITPKNLYKLEALNTPDLQLNCDPAYIEKQVALVSRKAKLILKKDAPKVAYGKSEVESLGERLQNRSQYAEHREFFEQYPYTTSNQIETVVKGYKNLRTERVEAFVPDLPEEAIEAMEKYNEHTRKICGKRAVFYIIADRKDFEKQTTKRDPVLLAQSPFGLVWQIIGAWDEEMVLLESL